MQNITIAKPNVKGQVVIPKKIRDALGINAGIYLKITKMGEGVYMYPVADVLTTEHRDAQYLKVLEKTRGAWAGDDWDQHAKRRRQIELVASRRRKKAW